MEAGAEMSLPKPYYENELGRLYHGNEVMFNDELRYCKMIEWINNLKELIFEKEV
jgi:hypothetical protein